MSNLIFVPEGLVVAGAVVLVLMARVWRRPRWWLPTAVAALALIALLFELWVGATLASFFGGAYVQDRFALFAKSAVLLAAALAIAVADWSDEEAPTIGMAMILLAAMWSTSVSFPPQTLKPQWCVKGRAKPSFIIKRTGG